MLHRNKFRTEESGQRILIIDGPYLSSDLYATVLDIDGHTLYTISTLQDALSNLTTYQPNLIMATPDFFYSNSYDLSILAVLKRANPNIPILAIFSQKDSDLLSSPYIAASLVMPFKMKQLRETVARLCGSKMAAAFDLTPSISTQGLGRSI